MQPSLPNSLAEAQSGSFYSFCSCRQSWLQLSIARWQVWDIERGRVITALPSPSIVNTVAFLRDAGIVVSGHHNGTLRFTDMRAKKSSVHEIAGLHTQGGVCGLAVGTHAGTPSTVPGCVPRMWEYTSEADAHHV